MTIPPAPPPPPTRAHWWRRIAIGCAGVLVIGIAYTVVYFVALAPHAPAPGQGCALKRYSSFTANYSVIITGTNAASICADFENPGTLGTPPFVQVDPIMDQVACTVTNSDGTQYQIVDHPLTDEDQVVCQTLNAGEQLP